MSVFKAKQYYKYEEDSAYRKTIDRLDAEAAKAAAKQAAKEDAAYRAEVKSRTYHWGPRGGCYYINANGNKVYVDHSYCR
jgi:hypothetical protein